MSDRVEIQIVTQGDPSGAKKVAEEIEKTGDAAAAAADKTVEAGKKTGDAVEKMETAVTASAEAVTEATEDISEGLSDVAEEAKTATDVIETSMADVEKATEDASHTVDSSMGEAEKSLDGFASKSEKTASGFTSKFTGVIKAGVVGLAAWAGAQLISIFAKFLRGMEESRSKAAETWGQMGIYTETYSDKAEKEMQAAGAAVQGYVSELDKINAALAAELEALAAREEQVKKRASDDDRLAESARKLAKARIDAAVAEGSISAEEGDRRKAGIEVEAASEDYENEKSKTEEIAAIRAEAAAAAAEAAKRAEELAAQAEAAAADFDSQAKGRQFDAIDPKANDAVAKARQRVSQAREGAEDPGWFSRIKDVVGNPDHEMRQGMFSNAFTGAYEASKIAVSAYEQWVDTSHSIAQSAKLLEEEEAKLAKAITARDEMLAAEAAARREAADKARAEAEQAQAAAAAAAAEAAAAGDRAGEFAPGGIEAQIRANEVAAEHATGAPVAAAPDIDASAIAALPPSRERNQFLSAIADGIERREVDFLRQLAASLDFEARGMSPEVRREIDQIRTQLEDLRTR